MKKLLTILALALAGGSAWAGNGLFVNNPDTAGTILLNVDRHVGMAKAETGEGDFYGTSLRGDRVRAGAPIFLNNPDTAGTILLDRGRYVGMGQVEKGEGDFYGTSLKAWGGDASVGMAEPERGSTDVYGSILLDINPRLGY